MAKSDPSALSEAAAAFDSELSTYARLGRLFVETPLASVKHLERANQTLGDIASCEERLQAAGTVLAQALGAVRTRQEQLAAEVIARVPALQERNKRLQELMGELGVVAGEVSGLNEVIGKKGGGEDASQLPTSADALDISQSVLGLSVRANDIASHATEAEFEEVATQAHALHQRLQTIGKKLQRAGGGGSA